MLKVLSCWLFEFISYYWVFVILCFIQICNLITDIELQNWLHLYKFWSRLTSFNFSQLTFLFFDYVALFSELICTECIFYRFSQCVCFEEADRLLFKLLMFLPCWAQQSLGINATVKVVDPEKNTCMASQACVNLSVCSSSEHKLF